MNFAPLLVLPLLLASSLFAKDQPVIVLHGAIMDSQCAYNVHSLARSHNWMIRKGISGAKDDRSCTLHCVKDKGGVYVLLVKQEVFRLDDQLQPEIYAGKNVKVTGTLDEKTHTLHVITMDEEK